jgi:ribonuclease inhibitor
MTCLEIDLTRVAAAPDIQLVFAKEFGFPGWYGHNWNAFWDLITSDYPLPDELSIRGLDHVERILPREADLMLRCFGDYNNADRVCCVSVTDDYDTRMFFLSYEARPTSNALQNDALGAIINCWIKADSAREANQIARTKIGEHGWDVVSQDEVGPAILDLANEGRDSFIRQACIDGAVFDYHTWSSEDEEDE